jgi:predicted DCC family thiol-disulfide oxidoreductase YuxK
VSVAGWTGGQYSLLRAAFALSLAVGLLRLLPYATELYTSEGVLGHADGVGWAWLERDPAAALGLLAAGAGAAVALALGVWTRASALVVWAVLAGLAARNPATTDSGAAYLGFACWLHAALPGRPYGSVAAVGRLDPAGDWSFPRAPFVAAWIVLVGTTTYSGLAKVMRPEWRAGTAVEDLLRGPLAAGPVADWLLAFPAWLWAFTTYVIVAFELGFALLALSARGRAWAWCVLTGASVLVWAAADSPDAGPGRLALLGLCFAPAWVPGARPGSVETVFFDGRCGLCHRAVRWILAEDRREDARFRFAPIDSEAFRAAVPVELRDRLPDSVLVLTEEGELLDRSRALLHLCARLGGLWRVLAVLGEALPLAFRDTLYDRVARIRHRLFEVPDTRCPIVAPGLAERFLD